MGLSGKRVAQMETKCNGDVFYGLFRYTPNILSNISPNHVHRCELHQGDWGAVGSIITFCYLIDGKAQSAKEVVEEADEKNKSVTYGAFEGDLMQIYKSLKAGLRVENKGENSLVTWTVEYEKINENVPDPDVIIDLAYNITKDIETHQLK